MGVIIVPPQRMVGLPWWLSSKESACNTGDTEDAGLIPGSGRSLGVGNGNPLQYSFLENSRERGSWWVTVHRATKSWTQLSTHTQSGYQGLEFL